MLPYFSYPFVYGNGSRASMPAPTAAPVPEVTVSYPQPASLPYMPVCPYQQMMPCLDSIDDIADVDDDFTIESLPFPKSELRVPVLSDNPPVITLTLFKELTGYPNYGNPSGNADILYTGDRGAWTFNLPALFFVPVNFRAQIVIRGVLDDHYDVPENRYSARIAVNSVTVHTGHVPFVHGRPANARFTNWRELVLNVPSLRRNNRVVIVNTSNTGPNDWIGLDWMELRLVPR